MAIATFFLILLLTPIFICILALSLFVIRLTIKNIVKKRGCKRISPISLIQALITQTPLSPHNTIIAFDLHNVIAHYDYKAIVKTFFASTGKLKLMLTLLNPLIWWDVILLKKNKSVVEQYIIGLGKKYKGLTPYISLGISIANCQRINPAMIAIIRTLKASGYTLHMFSNIGATICGKLQEKEPDLFAYFDALILPSSENGYLRKPNKTAYDAYFDKYIRNGTKPHKQILFIDDKPANIIKARQMGIIGICFRNPEQLEKTLKTLIFMQKS